MKKKILQCFSGFDFEGFLMEEEEEAWDNNSVIVREGLKRKCNERY